MGKTILLCGASGFIGGHVKARLESLGHEVVSLRRGLPAAIEGRPEAIINCAAELVDESKMIESNVELVHTLIDLAVKWHIDKVIQVGSSSEYGPTNEIRREDMTCVPSTAYERTKLTATEWVCASAWTKDIDACVARPFSVYGPNETPRKLIPQLWDHLMDGRTFELHDGSHDFIYIDDFVDGIVALLDAPREVTKGEIFNFGSGRSTSNHEVLAAFQEAANEMKLGCSITYHLNPKPFRPYDVTNWQADISKAARVLEWRPKVSFKDGLKRYMDWRWFEGDKG